ncbi:olfactory receptor 1019-like [Tachyglossus aculeatus]|uniref:olfactory receptor 1019-like n=1 Tax=Tachyglossus aculeatus TaxID=9261 RepID=UPI0018F6A9ED|nr:olfactory receptor 1019-like [Tachyglossus aculeatus]
MGSSKRGTGKKASMKKNEDCIRVHRIFLQKQAPKLEISHTDSYWETRNVLSLMVNVNESRVNGFLLLGIARDPVEQKLLFGLFLLVYMVTLVGNLGLICLIRMMPHLHTPMYFFLSNLSFLDSCYSSVTLPKMLADFLSEQKAISFSGCVVQLTLFIVFATAELYLLASMAYDRYVAICSPLLYPVLMSTRVCVSLVALSFVAGIINSLTVVSSIFQLSFCKSKTVNSFFCDIPPLLALSCSDTRTCEILVFALAGFIQLSSLLIVLISYIFIIITILKIRSPDGKLKSFSTCASHLAVVSLFYGTLIFMYLRPTSSYSLDQVRVVSVFYTTVIPMLNPIIYSLRNREVKEAVKRLVYKGF